MNLATNYATGAPAIGGFKSIVEDTDNDVGIDIKIENHQ